VLYAHKRDDLNGIVDLLSTNKKRAQNAVCSHELKTLQKPFKRERHGNTQDAHDGIV
jgi:hypothetical protein